MPNLFDLSVVYNDFIGIIKYLPVTLELTLISLVFGLLLGSLIALARVHNIAVIKPISTAFISMIRGTPVLVQLYITYFGIPILLKYINYYFGTNISVAGVPSIVYAIVALALNQSAFNAVVIEGALDAVNKGEKEAAKALGMTGFQRMIRIVGPEAIELALPGLGNNLIGLIKGTSLAFSCAVVEVTAQAKILGGRDYRYFEAYVALGIIYWIITIVLERILNWVVNRVKVPDVVGEENKEKIWRNSND